MPNSQTIWSVVHFNQLSSTGFKLNTLFPNTHILSCILCQMATFKLVYFLSRSLDLYIVALKKKIPHSTQHTHPLTQDFPNRFCKSNSFPIDGERQRICLTIGTKTLLASGWRGSQSLTVNRLYQMEPYLQMCSQGFGLPFEKAEKGHQGRENR